MAIQNRTHLLENKLINRKERRQLLTDDQKLQIKEAFLEFSTPIVMGIKFKF